MGASIFGVGLTLLAIGVWKANKLPHWIPLFWIMSTIIGFIGYFANGYSLLFVISGIMFGVSYAGAGLKVRSVMSNTRRVEEA